MTITKASSIEAEMFRYAKPRPKRLPGRVIKQLYTEFGIGGNYAAELCAWYLSCQPLTIQRYMTKTIRTNDYELLRMKLTEWEMQRMIDEQHDAKQTIARGPICEDGKRHKTDAFKTAALRKAEWNREYMRQKRAENKEVWRKPK